MLLDILTVVFIVAGLALVWFNLRQWRRHKIKIALDKPPRRPKVFEPDAE